jgi:hypothetical protein
MPDASERAATIRAAERWFERQGLPYFVPANAERVRSALSKSRMIPGAGGRAAGRGRRRSGDRPGRHDLSLGNLGGALVLGLMLGVYGLVSRHLKPIRVRDKVVDLPRHGRIRPAGLESDTV